MKKEIFLRNFGKNLRYYRKLRKIPINTLVSTLGVNYCAYMEIEQGKRNISIEKFAKIYKALWVDPKELLEGTYDEPSVLDKPIKKLLTI